MDNLDIWQKVARPPETALKKIVGGRLGGMTDINPQWRLKAMTEVFGPCGLGWKWNIERLWTEPGASGEVMAFALVNVSVWQEAASTANDNGNYWSEPIPGIGGSALIAKESAGLRANDEGFKMAVTDALSVAFKCLGVASDIYERKWDGTKYTDQPEGSKLPGPAKLSDRTVRPPDAPPLALTGDDDPLLTDALRKKLFALVNEYGVSSDDFKAFLKEKWDIESRTQIRQSMLVALGSWIRAHKKAVA